MATFQKDFSSGWGTLVLTVTESGTSSATNTGKISWTLAIKMKIASPSWSNGTSTVTVTIGGVRRYTGDSWDVRGVAAGKSKTIASGSFTATHSADGSLSLAVAAAISSSTQFGSASLSGTFTGTTIPRATTPSVSPSTATLGNNVTISTPRASSAFTHRLYYRIGSGSWVTIATGVGTSYTWTVPLSIANSFPNSTSGSITIRCITYNGSTQIGDAKTCTLKINVPNVPPSCSVSISEAVAAVTSAFGSRYVQGLSQLNIAIAAAGVYGSTIRSYSTSVDGVTYNSSAFTTNVINGSGSLTVKTTVSDSRGRTATVTKTINVLAYSPPAITGMTYQQCDADGTANPTGSSTKITISGRVTDVGGQNTRSLILKWKKSTDTTYQSRTLTTSGYTFTVSTIVNGTTTDETYEFIAVLADKIKTVEYEITTGIIAMSVLAGGKGIRFFGEAEEEGLVIDKINYSMTEAEYNELSLLGRIVRIIDWIYPVGSVITSVNPSYDPNKVFKTHTWVRFAAGRTLVGYNSSETEFNAVEKTGGAKTHTLTTAQIPSHSHAAVNGDSSFHFTQLKIQSGLAGKINLRGADGSATRTLYGASQANQWGMLRDDDTTAATGGSGAHNNLQPYITVYFWKRTA